MGIASPDELKLSRRGGLAGIGLEELTKIFPDGTVAVSKLSLDIADREFVVLVGPSGCGKTTALRMVAGLEEISSGTVRIGDRVVNRLSPRDRDVAMVFQNYALYPHLTVFDNMAFSLRLKKADKQDTRRKVEEAARILGLEDLLERKPRNLSGGQRQRVAMGRAIVREPQAFLMDEPLSNLDAKLRVQMRTEIARIQTRTRRDDDLRHPRSDRGDDPGPPGGRHEEGSPAAGRRPAGALRTPREHLRCRLHRISGHEHGRGQTHRQWRKAVRRIRRYQAPVERGIARVRPALTHFVGRTVILGIRPEDMEDASLVPGATADRRMSAEIDLLEALGSEVLVHFTVNAPVVLTEDVKELAADVGGEHLEKLEKQAASGTSSFVASLSPKTGAEKGGRLELLVDTPRLHFFDVETGLGIYERNPQS